MWVELHFEPSGGGDEVVAIISDGVDDITVFGKYTLKKGKLKTMVFYKDNFEEELEDLLEWIAGEFGWTGKFNVNITKCKAKGKAKAKKGTETFKFKFKVSFVASADGNSAKAKFGGKSAGGAM